MRLLRLLLAAVTLMASTSGAFAAEPQNGVDYTTLDATTRPDTGKKIEVVEFFMYSCPHCHSLEPLMSEWVKKQGDNIVFRRVHMAFSGPNDPQAHAYVTLEAMGKLDLVHDKIFRAVHVERNRLNKDEALTDFIAKNGVDKAKYLEFFNSFAVQTKMKRGASLINTYKLTSAPSIVIDGRFVTSPAQAGRPNQPELQSQQATLKVMDMLVARALKESGKGAAAAPAAPVKTAKK
ncbi:thiol:disulfide interchange protein DsbA/DsbL [Janthinobacterium fluminis]|uniref:Thiol:disulfide interchange protein DsbA n=1 Tax=Janthinobacterium fluminis TaxID=2987524 RepID=A0ABT5JXT4_9BURK|nr:thiol:disulfide interchange protein DsbA/DsbL [Janthinobacterium fluminis]MDC8757554.1 thiol:disulfide interchange protein DsbA/DsbL [Janthinobacterium fluminis]